MSNYRNTARRNALSKEQSIKNTRSPHRSKKNGYQRKFNTPVSKINKNINQQKRDVEKKLSSNFVHTEEGKDFIVRATRYLKCGYPVHFTGRAGTGKTALSIQLAYELNQPFTLIQGNHELNNTDLLGGSTGWSTSKTVDNFVRQVYKKEVNAKEKWAPGRLTRAVQKGHVLIYDEFSRSTPETNNILLSILEERVLPLIGAKEEPSFLPVHPDFKLILTSNPLEYAGVFQTQDALEDRLITMEVNFSKSSKITILQKRENLSRNDAELVWGLVGQVAEECEENGYAGPDLRTAMMISRITAKSKTSFNKENPVFLQICKDILSSYALKCELAESWQGAEQFIHDLITS